MTLNKKKKLYGFLLLADICIVANSCTHAPYVLPVGLRSGDPNICFETDIIPIFISNCTETGCHDAASRKGGYELDSYANIMKKGIVPGNSAASVIYESVAIPTFNVSVMPRNAPGLSATDISLLHEWIQTGAVDSGACSSACDSGNFTYSGAIEPLMQKYCIGCHNSASAAGGSLTDYASVENAAVNGKLIGNIEHLTGYDAMPATGISLSECQIGQVKDWVAAGALNN